MAVETYEQIPVGKSRGEHAMELQDRPRRVPAHRQPDFPVESPQNGHGFSSESLIRMPFLTGIQTTDTSVLPTYSVPLPCHLVATPSSGPSYSPPN